MFEMLNKIPDTKNGRHGWQETKIKHETNSASDPSTLSAQRSKLEAAHHATGP